MLLWWMFQMMLEASIGSAIPSSIGGCGIFSSSSFCKSMAFCACRSPRAPSTSERLWLIERTCTQSATNTPKRSKISPIPKTRVALLLCTRFGLVFSGTAISVVWFGGCADVGSALGASSPWVLAEFSLVDDSEGDDDDEF